MTVTVSGMNVAGKTRALPKVSFPLTGACCGKAVREQLIGDYSSSTMFPCRLCDRMLLPAYSRKQSDP